MQYVNGKWLYLTGLFPTNFPVFDSQSGKFKIVGYPANSFARNPCYKSAVHSHRVGSIRLYHTAIVHSVELQSGTHICRLLHGNAASCRNLAQPLFGDSMWVFNGFQAMLVCLRSGTPNSWNRHAGPLSASPVHLPPSHSIPMTQSPNQGTLW